MRDTEFYCERKLEKLNPGYSRIVKSVAVVLFNALEKYKLFFPDFTDHTVLHSLHVLEFCNVIIGDCADELNEDELFILIMSAYLHDCGMGITEDNYKELYERVVSSEYRLKHPHDNIKDTIRSFHHSFSKQMIYKYAPLFDIPSEQHMQAIALVSESHRKTDLFDEHYMPAEMMMPSGNAVRLPYLAALIRLADELDIASDRNLEIGDAGQQTIFKLMHHAIRRMRIEEDRFVLEIDTDDPALYDDILQETDKLKETLAYCVSVIERRTPFRIAQTKIDLTRIVSDKKKVIVLDTDMRADDTAALSLINTLPVKPDYVVVPHPQYGAAAILFSDYCSEAGTKNEIPFAQFEAVLSGFDAVTYITTGALTNLAQLLTKEEMLPRLSGIYVMGGGIQTFNGENETESNFARDPQAVKKLLSVGLNVAIFPLDVTENSISDTNVKKILPLLYLSHPDAFVLQDTRLVSDKYGHTAIDGDGEAVHLCTSIKDGFIQESC